MVAIEMLLLFLVGYFVWWSIMNKVIKKKVIFGHVKYYQNFGSYRSFLIDDHYFEIDKNIYYELKASFSVGTPVFIDKYSTSIISDVRTIRTLDSVRKL